MKAITPGLANIKTKLIFLAIVALLITLMVTPLPKAKAATGDISITSADAIPATEEIDFYVGDTLQFTVEGYSDEAMDIVISKYDSPFTTDKTASTATVSMVEGSTNSFQVVLDVESANALATSDFTPGNYVIEVVNSTDNSVTASQNFYVRSRFTGVQFTLTAPDSIYLNSNLEFDTTYKLKNGENFETTAQTAPFYEVALNIKDAEGNYITPYFQIGSEDQADDWLTIENGHYTVELDPALNGNLDPGQYTLEAYGITYSSMEGNAYGDLQNPLLAEVDFTVKDVTGAAFTPSADQTYLTGGKPTVQTTFNITADGETTTTTNTLPEGLFDFQFSSVDAENNQTALTIPEGTEVITETDDGTYRLNIAGNVFAEGQDYVLDILKNDADSTKLASLNFSVVPGSLMIFTENLQANLSPEFNANTGSYTLAATEDENSVVFDVKANSNNFTFTASSDTDTDVLVTSDPESGFSAITADLEPGENNIDITLTNTTDNTQQQYTVTVNKAEADNDDEDNNDNDNDDNGGGGGGGGGAPNPPSAGGGSSEEEEEDEVETLSEQNKCSDQEVEFNDITNHWAKAFIDQLGEMGAISGKSPGVFEPNTLITRAEATKIVLCSQGYEITADVDHNFPDIQGSWAEDIIATAKMQSIVNGYPDGKFRPNIPITRAEALVMLLNANKVNLTTNPKAPFGDVVQNSWYAEAVNYAYAQGIIHGYGDGTFGPGKNITRAEMAKIAFLTTAKEIYQ